MGIWAQVASSRKLASNPEMPPALPHWEDMGGLDDSLECEVQRVGWLLTHQDELSGHRQEPKAWRSCSGAVRAPSVVVGASGSPASFCRGGGRGHGAAVP